MPTPRRTTQTGARRRPCPTLARIEDHGVVGAGGGGFPTAVKLAAKVPTVIVNGAECEPLLHKDKELMQHAGRADAPRPRRGHGARVGGAGHHRDQEQVHRRAGGARAAAARGRSHPAAQRHLPGRRRVPAGPRRDWSRHPARRPAEGRRRRGGQRRDAGQHRPRPSRDPQVPDGRRRGPHARHAARTRGDSDRRPDRGGRRGDRRRCRGAARRRHDGTPGRRPR